MSRRVLIVEDDKEINNILQTFLEQKGYVQEFLCGSDASYAGRRSFYEQHGNYEIFDVEKDWIENDDSLGDKLGY